MANVLGRMALIRRLEQPIIVAHSLATILSSILTTYPIFQSIANITTTCRRAKTIKTGTFELVHSILRTVLGNQWRRAMAMDINFPMKADVWANLLLTEAIDYHFDRFMRPEIQCFGTINVRTNEEINFPI
jgi:hypothetical protein